MKTCFIFLILFSCYSFGAISDKECLANTSSKIYLKNDFSSGYPREVVFTCLYRCNNTWEVTEVLGTSSVRISNEYEEATKMVCQGVEVEKSKWGYEFKEAKTFYAFDTKISEIKKWAFDNFEFDLNNPQEKKLLLKLKKELEEVIKGFKIVEQTSPGFAVAYGYAWRTLELIEQELPLSDIFLQLEINKTLEINDSSLNEGETLVSDMLKTFASWRVPLR